MIRQLLSASAITAIVATASAQTTIAIVADKDATLYASATGDLANGAGNAMFAGMTGQPAARRALLHFDVANAIPAGSRILSARLLLSVQTSASPSPMPTDVHRISQDWSEGTTVAPGGQGSGAAAQAGDVTWLHTNYPSTLWNNVGGDFAATASFSLSLPASGPLVSDPLAGLIGDVQDWLDNPTSNFGWLLKSDELLPSTATKIRSRESSNPSDQPRIMVAYLTPGQTGIWGNGCSSTGGTITLTASGIASGGAVIPLDYASAPAQTPGATFFSLELVSPGTPLFANCSVYLPLNGTIVAGSTFLTTNAGTHADSLTVPVGFPGFLIVCQGAVLDSTAVGFAMSNAAILLTQ